MSDVPERVDVQLVDAAILFINQAVAGEVLTGSLEIGAYLFKTFFNNDIERAASRDANKPASYSALCSRPDLAVSRWTLSRMVRVAAREKFLVEIASPGHPPEPAGNRISPYGPGSQHCRALCKPAPKPGRNYIGNGRIMK